MASAPSASASTATASWCSTRPPPAGPAPSTMCATGRSPTARSPAAPWPATRRSSAREPRAGRAMIIEIGPQAYIGETYPDETLFFATNPAATPSTAVQTLPSLAALWRALGRADVELIVCHPNFSAPWSPRALGRAIFSSRFLKGRSPLLRAFGPELLRWRGRAQTVAVDHEDLPVINRNNLALLDRSALWFKRELPVDHWRVFLKTAHPNLPTPRFRMAERHRRWVGKLRPLSIRLPPRAEGLPPPPQPKTADIFFLARVADSSTARSRGLAELKALAA